MRFLETPATVWGAESVLIDEISRCKPEHQNRLFSLVHERRMQGLPLARLRYRWAAMNPCTSDQGGTEDYAGSEALDPALADRFALIVTAADWRELTTEQQAAIVAPSGEGRVTPPNEPLRAGRGRVARAVPGAGERVPDAGHHVRHDGRQRAQRRQHPHLAATRTPAGAQPRRRDDRRRPAVVRLVPQRARVQPAARHAGARRSTQRWSLRRIARRGMPRAKPRARGSTRSSPSRSLPRKFAAAARPLHGRRTKARRRSRS